MLVDFHNHVIPGVDDGASNDAEALEALRAFVALGAGCVVATPHVTGSTTLRANALADRMAELDAGWERLRRIAAGDVPDLRIERGAEIMLDTPGPDLSDVRLRLAGTYYVLCEYPYMMVPPNSAGVLRVMIGAGHVPIIAHPERYSGVEPGSRLPERWRHEGARLQINAGSLTGRYGEHARTNAEDLLERGLADFMCSDHHSRGRIATLGAKRLFTEAGGDEQFQLLTDTNPNRMLDGEAPLPVLPLQFRRSVADRVRRWFR